MSKLTYGLYKGHPMDEGSSTLLTLQDTKKELLDWFIKYMMYEYTDDLPEGWSHSLILMMREDELWERLINHELPDVYIVSYPT